MSTNIFYFIYSLFYVYSIANAKGYGSTDIVITKVEICKGPKRVDCAGASFIMKNNLSLTYELDLKRDITLSGGKIEGSCEGKPFVKYQMKNPCDNLFIKSLFKTFVNISDSCMVAKGQYKFLVDVENISQKYYNGVYFFGNWTYKSVFYGNSCNVICNVIELIITPKKKY
ncbi:uncharacterized protein LOC114250799 [Bombyx mandarina]|nr:uncharacterized protein LOC114250799 [Bombyx mandarina]